MIRINLLPEDLRKQEGTPWARRLSIYVGAGLLTALAFMLAIQRFVTLPGMRQEHDETQTALTKANEEIERDVKPLQVALDALEQRQRVAAGIQSAVIRWAPKLDGLQEALTADLDGVWLTGFAYEESRSKDPRSRDGVERRMLLALAASDFSDAPDAFSMSDKGKIAEVRRRLEHNRAFGRDLLGITCFSWSQSSEFSKSPWNLKGKAIAFPMAVLFRTPAGPGGPPAP